MRMKIAMGLMAAMAMSGPAMAGFGTVTFDLTSGGGNGPVMLALGAGGVVPVEVSFSATTSGTTGANRGVQGATFNLATNLPISDQVQMMLPLTFTNPRNPTNPASSTAGAGFSSFIDEGALIDGPDGDPNLDQIDAVGATQGLQADFDFTNTKGVLKKGSMEENVGHSGNVLMATGGIIVDTATPAGTYIMQLTPLSAGLWNTDPGGALSTPGDFVGDTLTLVIVPEPATLLLLAPVAWAIRRRRNA